MIKKIEISFILLFLISIGLKLFHLPFADMLAVITLGTASMFYYGFTVFVLLEIPFKEIFKKQSYTEISPILILGCIIIGWDYSVLVLGVLFKYLLIPQNSSLLVPGLFLITLMTAFGFFFIRKNSPQVFDNFMKRTMVIAGIALAFHMLPADKIIDANWSQHPDYANALKEQYHHPNDTVIQKKVQDEYDSIFDNQVN